MPDHIDMYTIQADFDRLAPLSGEGWNHNSHYHSLSQVRRICAATLPGAIVRKHLLWRYSIIWKKTTIA